MRLLARICFVAMIAWPQSSGSFTWASLDAQIGALYEKGDLARAIDTARAAVAAASSPHETGRSLDRLGFLLYTSGDLKEGEVQLRKSLEIRVAAFGADSLDASETANDLAMLLRDLRRMDEAKTLAAQAVASRERLLGATALPLAESLNTLGSVLALNGEYGDAVLRFESALAIHESRPAIVRASEEYGTLCVNAAGTYQRLGKYTAAEAAFKKGLDVLRVRPGVDHPAYAASEVAYAALEVDLGHSVEAERLYDESSRLVRQTLGDRHPVYATLLNNRGNFYQSIGNTAAAEADYRASLALKRALYGPNSALAVSTLRNLAQLTYRRDHREGERLLADAVDAYGRMAQAPPFDRVSVLVGLAEAQRDRGAVTDARATATRALEISRNGLGERHPLFASAMLAMGRIDATAGDAALAEREMREALRLAGDAHGVQHPAVASYLDALGDLFASKQDFANAFDYYTRSVALQERFAADVLEIGAESFKTQSLASAGEVVSRLIAFQAEAGPSFAPARTLAFETVTAWKGRVAAQAESWRHRVQVSATPQLRQQMDEWLALVECRSSLTVALSYHDLKPPVAGACGLPGTPLEGRYERLLSDLRTRWTSNVAATTLEAIAALHARADQLEAALNRAAGAPVRTARLTRDELQRRLGSDEALIEFVAFDSAGTGGSRRHYGAFVLDATGRLDWADLGAAAPIDSGVSDLLRAARDWSISTRHGERAAAAASAATAHAALRDLSTRVWAPVAPFINARSGVRRLRLAGDAALNLVPFDALPDGGDGRELIDRFTISYLPAGRDLAADAAAPSDLVAPRASSPVVVVSPGDRAATAVSQLVALGARDLSPLANARAEADDVRRVLASASLLAGATATEHNVKRLSHPSLLHIVGHGVVRDEDDCANRPCGSKTFDPSARAMSLAAIVLEEAYGRGASSTDDGLLTALELENVDLSGTEMLVLSQCQMASGLASVGEGVYGMRRAALIAGVRTFVAPLWNVEDVAERRFMQLFYAAVAAGKTRAAALREAKLALRADPATHDVLYWSPQILSGAAGTLPASLFRSRPSK